MKRRERFWRERRQPLNRLAHPSVPPAAANFRTFPDPDIAQHFGTNRDEHPIADFRMAVAIFLAATPNVTLCSIDTSSPTTAVSPMTTPVAWSINTPLPIFAPDECRPGTPPTPDFECRARLRGGHG